MLAVSDSLTERHMERFGSVKNAILIYGGLYLRYVGTTGERQTRAGNGVPMAMQRRTITLRGKCISRGRYMKFVR